ncbi:MAG: glycosyltransferase family 1 protein [Pseudoalteromonas sp.]|nr:glycosyltransferase family 1 protein [Pseudoalteromonas sp.]|tara:strand:+ start:9965 stop:11089 length:1125 start_codon:yes stop_codon:yes gene_type:complete
MNKKLLFIVNVDWFFISHRLPIALEAIEKGYEVHVACAVTDKQSELEGYGIKVHAIPLSRSGTNLKNELLAVWRLYKVVKNVSPDVAHMVTIKGAIYGGLVTRLQRVQKRVASISGLGFVFIDESLKSKVLRFFVERLYKLAFGKNIKVIFQNRSDESIFLKGKIVDKKQCILIRGSGVCLKEFKYSPEPVVQGEQKTVMFLARLLKDKGVLEFCSAALELKKRYNTQFVLVGDIDEHNPNSLTAQELEAQISSGAVVHWGYSKNINQVIPKSHIMVLPSYREGLPKSLIEAAACGRAVVTTDVPGCRDAIEVNETGLLVEKKSVPGLVDAISKLLEDEHLRLQLGKAGRALAERSFDINDVIARHLEIYKGNK